MKYLNVFEAKEEPGRNFDIIYCLCKEENSFCIESYIPGGSSFEKAFLGNCGEEKAEQITLFLAKNAVRPIHIENIISDMRL